MKFRLPRPNSQPKLGHFDLDPEVNYSIACGLQQLESTRLIIQRRPTVEYQRCQTCFAKFVDRQSTELFLSDYYQPDRYPGTVAGSWSQIPKVLGWSVKTIYSRPSISDVPLSSNPVGYLASTILKIPGRIDVAVRERPTQRSIARYECAGRWEVMYQRVSKDSRHFGPELKY